MRLKLNLLLLVIWVLVFAICISVFQTATTLDGSNKTAVGEAAVLAIIGFFVTAAITARQYHQNEIPATKELKL